MSLQHSEIHQLHHPLYVPKNEPVATILIVHGMQEHSGRYQKLASYLKEIGFVVLTYDHLGHGKTAKTETEKGFFQLENPSERLVSDAGGFAHYLNEKYPTIPHFILGHSMGSFITRILLQHISGEFDGAIIMGTGERFKGMPFLEVFLGLMNAFLPRRRSSFIYNVFNKLNNRKFSNEPNAKGTNWLSLSKRNREQFLQDPLILNSFSNNGFYTVMRLNKEGTRRSWAESIRKDMPMLFLSGEDDPIGDFGKGIRKTVNNLKSDGFEDISIKLYPEMRHEILNESIWKEVFEDIRIWIEKQVAKR